MDEVYDFGVILQKLRKEKGFTQEQLARLIHKESSIISRYEKGLQNPTLLSSHIHHIRIHRLSRTQLKHILQTLSFAEITNSK
ncbi:helix-turn-helix domain-containing protein [Ruminococcus sp.]|uniref:helix-turn-helix domain-containing protein n=1 Tax=Ruminococcus sp. TaxID=41978 RepID=UPI004028136E